MNAVSLLSYVFTAAAARECCVTMRTAAVGKKPEMWLRTMALVCFYLWAFKGAQSSAQVPCSGAPVVGSDCKCEEAFSASRVSEGLFLLFLSH